MLCNFSMKEYKTVCNQDVGVEDRDCYMCQINTAVMKKQVGCLEVLGKNFFLSLSNHSIVCRIYFYFSFYAISVLIQTGRILLQYFAQHCFICRPSDSTMSEDAGIELRTVATSAFSVRKSDHARHPQSARFHPQLGKIPPKLG
jgi:hypothetical protein